MTGAEIVRVLSTPDPLARFVCPRFACEISRLGCGRRWTEAQQQHPLAQLIGCRRCRVGEGNARFVQGPTRLRDAKESMRRRVSVPPRPRVIAPFVGTR